MHFIKHVRLGIGDNIRIIFIDIIIIRLQLRHSGDAYGGVPTCWSTPTSKAEKKKRLCPL